MRAEDGVVPAVRDQLAKALGSAVCDGTEQVVVAGYADDRVMLLRGRGPVSPTRPYSGSVKLPLGTTS